MIKKNVRIPKTKPVNIVRFPAIYKDWPVFNTDKNGVIISMVKK